MTTDLTLILDEYVLTRLRAAAAEAGVSPEEWAASALIVSLATSGFREEAVPFDPALSDELLAQQTPEARAYQHAASLAALEEYDRTGISYPLEDVLAEVRADLETRLAAKG